MAKPRRAKTDFRSPLQPLNIYERSKQQRAERERRLESLRKQLMAECTFTPKTGSGTRSKSPRTPESSSDESVFDRLYQNRSSVSSEHSTPIQSNRSTKDDSSPKENRPTSLGKRIETLYEEGVKKLRNRPINDEEEKSLRDWRLEEKEMNECCFRPRRGPDAMIAAKKSAIVMQPKTVGQVVAKRRSPPNQTQFMPKEIVFSVEPRLHNKHQPWHTPLRKDHIMRHLDDSMDFMIISPLRRNRMFDDSASPSDDMDFKEKNDDDQLVSLGDHTDYGSI
jgi:hypothetical protein